MAETTIPTVPENVKPAYEWFFGRAIQKVSPRRRHAIMQREWGQALRTWAGRRVDVGTEWRFRITPPDGETRLLVPDVAFVEKVRLDGFPEDQREEPPIAPDVAVEIRSPDDRERYLEEKTRVYLAAGCRAVIVVDPVKRTVESRDNDGRRTFTEGETFSHPAMPGFALDLARSFEELD